MFPGRGPLKLSLSDRVSRLDDPVRLQALADYGNPDAERIHQLQELVALASRLMHAEIAMVALVGRDRVDIHALHGPRPVTTIAVSPVWAEILAADPLYVWQADGLSDGAGIPAVSARTASPGLFVAVPLVSPEHAVIGALCISDPVPRRLVADDRAALAMLANQAMSLMELHRLIRREAAARRGAADMAGRLQLAFSLADLGDWRWAPDRDVTELSPRAARMHGLPAEQQISRGALREVIVPEQQEEVRRAMEEAIRERCDFDLEYRVRRPDGSQRWLRSRGTGVRDEVGKIVEMVGVVQDITARRAAEAQMQTREDRAWMKAELIERVHDLDQPGDVAAEAIRIVVERLGLGAGGICLVDETAALVAVKEWTVGGEGGGLEGVSSLGIERLDPGLARRLGAGAPVEIDDLLSGPVRSRRRLQLFPLVERRQLVALFWFATSADRDWRDGEALAIQSIVDLAYAYYGRAQARRSAKAGERRLLLVADWMPQLAWLARADGRPFWFNRRWFEYCGQPSDALVEVGWESLCHPVDRAQVEDGYRRAVQAGDGGWEATFRLRRADGQYRWHLSRAISIATGSDEDPVLWFGTQTDVTEQRQLAEKREVLLDNERLARREAEGANRLKDEFLAMLSHELRTPLTAMLGWSQVLSRTEPDAALVRQGVEIIERNAQVQSQIIEDLLDMSAIASGKLRLDRRAQRLGVLVDAAVLTVLPAARARGIAIVLDGPADPVVLADSARLQQALSNLLTNAIKFSPPGSTVRLCIREAGDRAEVAVRDDGIGMRADFLPHVFERFRQADGSNTRLHGGLGLGLAIVRQLMELHGGSVRAHSDGLGLGSTFTLTLPIHAAPSSLAVPGRLRRHESSLAGRTLLIVEDQEDTRSLLRLLLEARGATVIEAASAGEALILFERRELPDLLVSDIGLPGLDGFEFLVGWRRAEAARQCRPIPAIALSAFVDERHVAQIDAAGFDARLAKPVDIEAFVATALRLLDEGASRGAARPA